MAKGRTAESHGPEYLQFGANVAKLRKARGLSQVEIAAALGINQSTYAGWETGTRKVQLSTMLQLSKFFGVSVDSLIGTKELSLPAVKDRGFDLKESEKNLVLAYRRLSREGKQKLTERADELIELGYVEKGAAEKMA